MVGRMEGQSVVLRAEKGKLRLMVDDEEGGGKQEMVYDVTAQEKKQDRSIEMVEREETDGKDREAEGGEARDRGEERAEGLRPYGRGEMPGGALGMDGQTETRGGMPGVGGCVEYIEPVAGAGDGGDALGLAATSSDDREDSGIELASCGIIGAEEQGGWDERIGAAFGPTPEEFGQARGTAGNCTREEGLTILREIGNGGEERTAPEGEGTETRTEASAGDSPGSRWSLDGKAGNSAIGGVAQNVLRVGGEVAKSHGPGVGESSCGKTARAYGPGEGGPSGANPGVGEEAGSG
jgi:hypothetical protein